MPGNVKIEERRGRTVSIADRPEASRAGSPRFSTLVVSHETFL